jgi:hypothetical protein
MVSQTISKPAIADQLIDSNDSVGRLKMHGDYSVFAIVILRVNPYNLNVTNNVCHIAPTIFLNVLFIPRNLNLYNLCMGLSLSTRPG